MRRFLLPALLLAASVLLALPAPEARSFAVQSQLHETSLGLHMLPERIDAQVGDVVTVEVTNMGTSRHHIVFCSGPVEGQTCPSKFGESDTLDPGETGNVTLPIDRPGTFEYFCDIGLHRQGGMRGEMIVQGQAAPTGKDSPGLAPALVLPALALLALVLRRR